MIKTPLKQKILLLLCSMLASLLLLEAGLRIAGVIHLSIRDHQNKTALTKRDSYRILCVGESTTYLDGENNYPNYLSELLNASHPTKSFNVINKGTPGVSTDFIIENITSWINEYHPDIVLAMMGVNDDMLLSRDEKPDSPPAAFLKTTRVYKLACWLTAAIKNRLSKTAPGSLTLKNELTEDSAETESAQTIIDQFFERINRTPLEYRTHYKIAVLLEGNRHYALSEQAYKELLVQTEDPIIQKWLYKKLGEVLRKQNKYTEFVNLMPQISFDYWGYDWIKYVCTEDADIRHVESVFQSLIESRKNNAPFYDLLAQCYAYSGKTAQAEGARQKAKEAMLRTIHPATQRNYLKLAQILARHNIIAVYVQYPLRSVEPLKKILSPAPNSDRMIVVDNEAVFKQALAQASVQEYFIDLFAGDFGHCTERGNRLLAQNIASVLSNYTK